jgi:hypothetical protein
MTNRKCDRCGVKTGIVSASDSRDVWVCYDCADQIDIEKTL